MTRFTFKHVDHPTKGECGWCHSKLDDRPDFYWNWRPQATVKLLCPECAEKRIAELAHFKSRTKGEE